MSAFTLIHTRAANVIPSDAVNIPYPNIVLVGENTDVGTNLLIDDTLNFLDSGIKVGDTVYSAGDAVYALVVSVSANQLELSADIFPIASESYLIYQGTNNGCYIYVPAQEAGAFLSIETIGGDQVRFYDPPVGILNVQVAKVLEETTANKLVALW